MGTVQTPAGGAFPFLSRTLLYCYARIPCNCSKGNVMSPASIDFVSCDHGNKGEGMGSSWLPSNYFSTGAPMTII